MIGIGGSKDKGESLSSSSSEMGEEIRDKGSLHWSRVLKAAS